ncbi:hypothetical protein SAMN05444392_11052 [Seinonella peptonophila]|uniref:Uncharacterized protein n=1 Tax=Seinonella peptonophila TaxID=112248 RepID=A0A1M4ZQ92_9BACL|nr:hypothetical protein [Seinonella peptonophila]SHF20168.1 hypothetical protein SAMN05444392_11052 [Seinonella peptonophila]
MGFKKITVLFFGLLFALLVVPFSSAFADTTLLWSGGVTYNSDLDAYITPVDSAHASGTIQVCNTSSFGRWFYIKDHDPDGSDEYLYDTMSYLSPGYCGLYYIQNLVDGTNGKAEIYLQTSNSGSSFSISQYY